MTLKELRAKYNLSQTEIAEVINKAMPTKYSKMTQVKISILEVMDEEYLNTLTAVLGAVFGEKVEIPSKVYRVG